MTSHLFVYGSLRPSLRRLVPAEESAVVRALDAKARLVGPGAIQGRLFRVASWFPGLKPALHSPERVRGDVYAFDDLGLLGILDAYEEVDRGLYERRLAPVTLDADGAQLQAWCYFYLPETSGEPIETGDFATIAPRSEPS